MIIYRVSWSIDVYAESSLKAAQEALRVQRDPSSIATVFEVREGRSKTPVIVVDLGEERLTDAEQDQRLRDQEDEEEQNEYLDDPEKS